MLLLTLLMGHRWCSIGGGTTIHQSSINDHEINMFRFKQPCGLKPYQFSLKPRTFLTLATPSGGIKIWCSICLIILQTYRGQVPLDTEQK